MAGCWADAGPLPARYLGEPRFWPDPELRARVSRTAFDPGGGGRREGPADPRWIFSRSSRRRCGHGRHTNGTGGLEYRPDESGRAPSNVSAWKVQDDVVWVLLRSSPGAGFGRRMSGLRGCRFGSGFVFMAAAARVHERVYVREVTPSQEPIFFHRMREVDCEGSSVRAEGGEH